jgi:aryl-alcohol dehydrogenase-like predicted oxidoreductase
MMTTNGLPRRRLGRTALEVSALSLGGVGVGGLHEQVAENDGIETVEYALANGINYIDTSPLYGDSERRIGIALEGVPRDRYILSTKMGTHRERWGDYSWDGALWSVENSLKLLKTDHIEILLIHDPRDEEDVETIFGSRGALEALEHLRSQSVIDYIGLGQRNHAWHRRAIESGRFDVILTYNDYHPVRTTALTDGLLALAKQHDVGVLNGSPLAHGLLNGDEPRAKSASMDVKHPAREVAAAQRLYEWSQANNVPMVAVVLQYCLRQPLIDCTLSGAKTAAEVAQNLMYLRMEFPASLWEDLEALHLTADQV